MEETDIPYGDLQVLLQTTSEEGMEMEKKLGEFVSNIGKTAKGLMDTAIQSVDQNDDGKFDFSDVSVIAENVGTAVKKGSQAVMNSAEERARLLELKALQPIFASQQGDAVSLDDADFLMPKFIRVTDRDKRHAESEVCQGSIGYTSDQKGLHIVNIFKDSVDAFGLTFYPDCDCEFYYMDPSDRDNYIALDEYFSYLKIVRINELKKLAQDLGAKHFKVTYMEEKTSFSSQKAAVSLKTPIVKADSERGAEEKKFTSVKIEADSTFPGHAPIRPQLKYLQRDPSIQNLVAMRMDENSPLIKERFMLNLSQSSGMKENDAVKIDAVLKGMKCSGNTTVANEVKNEARRYLEYEIEF